MQRHLKEESRLWDYGIAQRLGKGQYGQVFKVTNKKTGRVYALKKMTVSNTQQKQKIQAFREVKCLKLLSHPCIIQYQQSFLSMDNIYIVMEYASKGDFLKIIEERRRKQRYFTETQLWKIFKQIVQGVKYLHEKDIIHRDLKVENIFMTEDGNVKIGDLGMSKIMHRSQDLISTRVGTPIYFAPEMIKNQLYSFGVDIWSLGCVFYYLAMLEHPFQEATIETLPFYVIDQDPKPIKGNYSPELIEFINLCFVKDPKKRMSVFELAIRLKSNNSPVRERVNKVSIFNLRHLTKIISASKQIQKEKSKEDLDSSQLEVMRKKQSHYSYRNSSSPTNAIKLFGNRSMALRDSGCSMMMRKTDRTSSGSVSRRNSPVMKRQVSLDNALKKVTSDGGVEKNSSAAGCPQDEIGIVDMIIKDKKKAGDSPIKSRRYGGGTSTSTRAMRNVQRPETIIGKRILDLGIDEAPASPIKSMGFSMQMSSSNGNNKSALMTENLLKKHLQESKVNKLIGEPPKLGMQGALDGYVESMTSSYQHRMTRRSSKQSK